MSVFKKKVLLGVVFFFLVIASTLTVITEAVLNAKSGGGDDYHDVRNVNGRMMTLRQNVKEYDDEKKSIHTSSGNGSRKLSSFESIAGYSPQTLVTDHNAIDLDQKAIMKYLDDTAWKNAMDIYELGAYSKSVATVKLGKPLGKELKKGANVIGFSGNAGSAIIREVRGSVYEDTEASSLSLKIQYDTSSIQTKYLDCQVGGNPDPNIDGCFAEESELLIDGFTSPVNYTYDVYKNNLNYRSIKQFSTDAKKLMHDPITPPITGMVDNRPYPTYQKFYNYYKVYAYADNWISSAFNKIPTKFENGNADFTNYDDIGRLEAIQKGTAYMSIWMYVIREMEDAIEDCRRGCSTTNTICNSDPVHAWDEAVAFYTGSLEGQDGAGNGVLLRALADKRCGNFKTCGALDRRDIKGTSYVNIEVLRQFLDGQRKLNEKNCEDAIVNKERITQLMSIPLIQGTLRYAYIQDTEVNKDNKAEGEGATFAAAVLPLVHNCSAVDAELIYNHMKVKHTVKTNFKTVKEAFERNYDCMNIKCEEVGGLYDPVKNAYFPNAKPCPSSRRRGDGQGLDDTAKLGLGLSAAGIVVLAVIVYLTGFCGPKAATPELASSGEGELS